MPRFPVDAPKAKVITMPNHSRIKGSTLRAICTQAGIPREEFREAFGS